MFLQAGHNPRHVKIAAALVWGHGRKGSWQRLSWLVRFQCGDIGWYRGGRGRWSATPSTPLCMLEALGGSIWSARMPCSSLDERPKEQGNT